MVCSRRQLCAGLATLAGTVSGCLTSSGADSRDDGSTDDWAWSGSLPVTSVVQYHDPSCGCCSEYAAYLESNDIDVDVKETDDLDGIKRDRSIPEEAMGCHTVEIGDYLVEGHVPLEAIEELLEDEPAVLGIAAPGMPRYSPGMGPRGDDPLTIYAFTASGEIREYTEV